MPNSYYNQSGAPSQGSSGSSAVIRAEFLAIVAGFDKLPTLGGNAGQVVVVNGGATGLTTSSALTFSGSDVSIGGALSLSNGSAAAPSLRFANSLTTGLYRAGADQIGVAIAGANAGTWSASALALAGGLSVAGVAGFASGSAAAPSLSLSASPTTGFYRAGADQIGVAIAGVNAGVIAGTGWTVPLNMVVNGGGATRRTTQYGNTGGDLFVGVESSAGGGVFSGSGAYSGVIGTNNATSFHIATNGVVRLTGNSAGDFGLNCTPVGTAALRIQVASNNDAGIEWFRDSATRFRQQFYNRAGGAYVDAQFDALTYRFATSGTLRATLNNSGEFGLNCTPVSGITWRVVSPAGDDVGIEWERISSTVGTLRSYNRIGATFTDLRVDANSLSFRTGASERAAISSAGVFTYGGDEIGWRNIPRVTGGLIRGSCFATSAGFTVNTADLAAGNALCVYNDSAASITITQGAGVTLRLAGTATTGNRTLAARGYCTIWGNSGSEAIVMGSGVS